MRFSIRPAEPSDARAIAEVHVRGWRWGYRGLLPEELLEDLDANERAERLLAVMNDPGLKVAVHVAEAEAGAGVGAGAGAGAGAVIGFVSSGPSREPDNPEPDPTGEVYALYVDEDVAGKGVGAALLRAAVDDLRRGGFERASLWVLDTNARARRFYEREGWLPDGGSKTEDFHGHELREVRLERPLSS